MLGGGFGDPLRAAFRQLLHRRHAAGEPVNCNTRPEQLAGICFTGGTRLAGLKKGPPLFHATALVVSFSIFQFCPVRTRSQLQLIATRLISTMKRRSSIEISGANSAFFSFGISMVKC